jgi:hypothetical protein
VKYKLTLFCIILLIIACNKTNKHPLPPKKGIYVQMEKKYTNKLVICIKVINNTDTDIFIPMGKLLPKNLNAIYIGNKITKDTSEYFYYKCGDLSGNYYLYKRKKYEEIAKICSCKIEDSVLNSNDKKELFLSIRHMNQDISLIDKDTNAFFKEKIKNIIFIKKHKFYSEFIIVPSDFLNNKYKIFFSYPESSLEKKTIKINDYFKDIKYPSEIKGYKLYNKPIYSDTINLKYSFWKRFILNNIKS